MTLREQAQSLMKDIPTLSFALHDSRTPVPAKLLAALTVAYALSPIDLIPDFIPILGYLDDLLLLPLLIAVTIRLIPKDVWQQSRKRAEACAGQGIKGKAVYALPVIAVWCILLCVILKAVLS